MSTSITTPEPEDVRADWWQWASCNSGDGSQADLFFPDLGGVPVPNEHSTDEERKHYGEARAKMFVDEARAKAICAECAVSDLCLAGAVARQEQTGVWGGFNFARKRERTTARRHLQITLVAA